jgi:hypothetical protein
MNSALSIGLSVSFRRAVLDSPDAAPNWSPWSRNLILDCGLDMPASNYTFAQCVLSNIVVGTSTNPTRRDSGTVTATRSGATVTATGAFFSAADVGRVLKFNSGELGRVATYIDATQVTLATSGTVAASAFTVWHTSDTGHGAEYATTSNYMTGAGESGTAFTDGTLTSWRTFLFSAFGETKVLREIGWRPTATGNLYGRALIPGGGDAVAAGQYYKVQVSHSLVLSPLTPTAVGNVGTGLDTSGASLLEGIGLNVDGTVQYPIGAFATVSPTGSLATGGALEPSSGWNSGNGRHLRFGPCTNGAALGAGTAQLAPSGSAVFTNAANSNIIAIRASYAAGSCSCTFTAFYNTTQALGEIKSFCVSSGASPWYSYFRHLLDSSFTKTNEQTLTCSITVTWGRVLEN